MSLLQILKANLYKIHRKHGNNKRVRFTCGLAPLQKECIWSLFGFTSQKDLLRIRLGQLSGVRGMTESRQMKKSLGPVLLAGVGVPLCLWDTTVTGCISVEKGCSRWRCWFTAAVIKHGLMFQWDKSSRCCYTWPLWHTCHKGLPGHSWLFLIMLFLKERRRPKATFAVTSFPLTWGQIE